MERQQNTKLKHVLGMIRIRLIILIHLPYIKMRMENLHIRVRTLIAPTNNGLISACSMNQMRTTVQHISRSNTNLAHTLLRNQSMKSRKKLQNWARSG
jgi:hypothetical protein